MKNTVKYIFIAISVVIISAFAGCAQVDIEASISEDNLVTYTYKLDFEDISEDDINYTELDFYLFKLKNHWDDEGFETTINKGMSGIRVVSTIEEQCSTRQEAFEKLYGYMTNDISPFTNAEYEYNQNFYFEDYSLSAELDLRDLVNSDVYEAYPEVVGKDVDEFMENIKCSVSISLPMNESQTSDNLEYNAIKVDVPLDAPAKISIDGRINNNVNVRYEQNLLLKKAKEEKHILIFAIIGFLTIAGLITLLLVRKKNMPKTQDEIEDTQKDVENSASIPDSNDETPNIQE